MGYHSEWVATGLWFAGLHPEPLFGKRQRALWSLDHVSPLPRVRAEMSLSELWGDVLSIVFSQLCNSLEPRIAVDFSSTSCGIWTQTQALRQQLRAAHIAAAVLCHRLASHVAKGQLWLAEVDPPHRRSIANGADPLGARRGREWLWGCARRMWRRAGLHLLNPIVIQTYRLDQPVHYSLVSGWAECLGAGSLPAVTFLCISMKIAMHTDHASALAAALERGALPRLETLFLSDIGNAGLVALAPALRRGLPALENLNFNFSNSLGDEGLAALVAPPPLAGALPLPNPGLTKLKVLGLLQTQISDAGCAALVSALDNGALPALKCVRLEDIPASHAAILNVHEAVERAQSAARATASRVAAGAESPAPPLAPSPTPPLRAAPPWRVDWRAPLVPAAQQLECGWSGASFSLLFFLLRHLLRVGHILLGLLHLLRARRRSRHRDRRRPRQHLRRRP